MSAVAPRRIAAVLVVGIIGVVGSVPEARAHHGREYLLVQTTELPHRGGVFVLSDQAVQRGNGETAFSLSPAVLLGLADRVSIEVHSHIDQEPGEGWSYEATAPELRISLTPPGSTWPLRAALSAEYEFGRGHAHDRLAVSGVLGVFRGHSNLTVNLTAAREQEDDARTGWSYAAGFRPRLDRSWDVGLELRGALNDAAEEPGHELLLGPYARVGERFTIKAGLGRGFGDAPEWSFRTGFVIGK